MQNQYKKFERQNSKHFDKIIDSLIAQSPEYPSASFSFLGLEQLLLENGALRIIALPLYSRKKKGEIQNLSLQLAQGIKYLHDQRILHRDLKLGNILIKDGTIQIADFGLSIRLSNQCPERDTMCGTANYIAPEIVNNQKYSFEADCWSFGCILYAMATGTPPFESNSIQKTIQRVQKGEIQLPSENSEQLRDLIKKSLDMDSQRRSTIDEILLHPFYKLIIQENPKEQELIKNQVRSVTTDRIELPAQSIKLNRNYEKNNYQTAKITQNSPNFSGKIASNSSRFDSNSQQSLLQSKVNQDYQASSQRSLCNLPLNNCGNMMTDRGQVSRLQHSISSYTGNEMMRHNSSASSNQHVQNLKSNAPQYPQIQRRISFSYNKEQQDQIKSQLSNLEKGGENTSNNQQSGVRVQSKFNSDGRHMSDSASAKNLLNSVSTNRHSQYVSGLQIRSENIEHRYMSGDYSSINQQQFTNSSIHNNYDGVAMPFYQIYNNQCAINNLSRQDSRQFFNSMLNNNQIPNFNFSQQNPYQNYTEAQIQILNNLGLNDDQADLGMNAYQIENQENNPNLINYNSKPNPVLVNQNFSQIKVPISTYESFVGINGNPINPNTNTTNIKANNNIDLLCFSELQLKQSLSDGQPQTLVPSNNQNQIGPNDAKFYSEKRILVQNNYSSKLGQQQSSKLKQKAFDTNGLKPTQFNTQNGKIEITNDLSMIIEISNGQLLYKISPDGKTVSISNPLIRECTQVYSVYEIPDQYVKFYQYAVQVCEKLKSKSPQITLKNEHGLFSLMCDFSNFEAELESGIKIFHQIKDQNIRVVTNQGTVIIVDISQDTSFLTTEVSNSIKIALKYQTDCIQQSKYN